jgi:hypothetical protein
MEARIRAGPWGQYSLKRQRLQDSRLAELVMKEFDVLKKNTIRDESL